MVMPARNPLAVSRDLLAGFAGQEVLVGFSGGKDSLAVLELAVEAGVKPLPFCMHLVAGLRCVEENLRPAERRYGVKVLRLPHWDLPRLMLEAVYRPHMIASEAAKLRKLTILDVESLLRLRTGARWVFYGQRMTDSLERRGMLSKCAGRDENTGRAYPIYTWADRHVKAFLRARRIRMPGLAVARSSGVGLDLETLVFMREHYPDDLTKLLEVFPYAQAALVRYDSRRAAEAVEAPGVHDGDDPA